MDESTASTPSAKPARNEDFPFDGFVELVKAPLEVRDPVSFKRVRKALQEIPTWESSPFRMLLMRLTGKDFREKDAKERWREILLHKQDIEEKLGRIMGIQAAALDYFDVVAHPPEPLAPMHAGRSPRRESTQAKKPWGEPWVDRVFADGYYLEKLREEILRAKRYKHALSAILIDVDSFSAINERLTTEGGDRLLVTIVEVVKKTIRTVDILARYANDQFLVVLPNTNKREAQELAERIRRNVRMRTRKQGELDGPVTITASVDQSTPDKGGAAEFVKHLESILKRGKDTARDAVYGS